MTSRAYTVASLAAEWECSEGVIRKAIAEGRLAHFRLGTLIRITAEEVRRFECQNTRSSGSEADTLSSIETQEDGGADTRTTEPQQGLVERVADALYRVFEQREPPTEYPLQGQWVVAARAALSVMDDEAGRLRELVWLYVDPFDVKPEHRALVNSIGKPDSAAQEPKG